MEKLTYSKDELMRDHAYTATHEIGGIKLHGGFDESGTYISPRTKERWPAVRAWAKALEQAGAPLLDASNSLLSEYSLPNAAQQKILIQNGLGDSFWNALTITGVFEGRGKGLCEFDLPDFQDVIVEDISKLCVGHLHKGLLYAHGADEGGDPALPEIGAHDSMWFVLRDLVFGANAYPIPEIPETLSRPSDGSLFPQLNDGHANLLDLLLNLLMIEVRAENFFAICCDLFRDENLFVDRRDEALEAAQMVEHIRTDEAIHVLSLQVALSEMRILTFKTKEGGEIQGGEFLDPAWKTITKWHGKDLQRLNRDATRIRLHDVMFKLPNGDALVSQFDSLEG